ncbi:MAG: hypothetical protein JW820_12910 [Spirochaetales bacterium]|nr:hypothetical protein [Spirochaetales bacterium]
MSASGLSSQLLFLPSRLGEVLFGHRPIETDVTPDHFSRALYLQRPEVSQVYYAALEVERPQAWFRFEGCRGQEVLLMLGVPVIERLTGYRPSMALLGPGLPPETLGFETPVGVGAVVYPSEGQPRRFHEPFTGTESWIHLRITRTLPDSGTFYLAAFTPENPRPGDKLWLSMGRLERFYLRDLWAFGRWRRNIRSFHELS